MSEIADYAYNITLAAIVGFAFLDERTRWEIASRPIDNHRVAEGYEGNIV